MKDLADGIPKTPTQHNGSHLLCSISCKIRCIISIFCLFVSDLVLHFFCELDNERRTNHP
uniref:Uncharacterized protein n=1 Tax=Arundo donax TaxID=35708 RepID=A0A0A9CUJ3_ARUDO